MEKSRAQWILGFFRDRKPLDRAWLIRQASDDEIKELLKAGYIRFIEPNPKDFMDDGHYIITSEGMDFRAQR